MMRSQSRSVIILFLDFIVLYCKIMKFKCTDITSLLL